MAITATKEQIAEWEAKGLIAPTRTNPIAAVAQKIGTPARQPTAPEPARLRIEVTIPVRTASESNMGGSLRGKLARKACVKAAIRGALVGIRIGHPGPFRVTLTRGGRGRLDQGNLGTAMKAVQDVVAEWLSVDDGDRSRVRWRYRQRPAWRPCVTIRIEA